MPPATRFLQTSSGEEEPPEPISVDSDVVVILAALLCALICLVGLALVARCAWLRRAPAPAAGASPAPLANKGLKKKDLRALPKVSYAAAGDAGGKLSAECAICLAEFEEGDEVRVLPQCGHGFHVGCVDMWLGSHASCPSCRSVLVVVPMPAPAPLPPPMRCHRCGARSCGIDEVEAEGDANRFLP